MSFRDFLEFAQKSLKTFYSRKDQLTFLNFMQCFFEKHLCWDGRMAVWGSHCVLDSSQSIWWWHHGLHGAVYLTPKRVQSLLKDLVLSVIPNHCSVHWNNKQLSNKHITTTNKSKSMTNIYKGCTIIKYNHFLNCINSLRKKLQLLIDW